jgi:hypothetical protein
MEERRGSYTFLVGNMRQREHFEDIGVDWSIILK